MKFHLIRISAFALLSISLPMQAFAAQCDFSVIGEWQSGFTASVTITNNTDSPIDGWEAQLSFTDGTRIENLWNANLSGNNPSYRASNQEYNRQIAAGQSTSFGFNGAKAGNDTPVNIPQLAGICAENEEPSPTEPEPVEPPPAPAPPSELLAHCEYTIENQWNNGFTAKVVIENQGTTDISNWLAELSYPDNTSVTDVWRASVQANGSNKFNFQNADYNAQIAPGSRVDFGFNANGQADSQPILSGICRESLPPPNVAPIAQATASALSGAAPLNIIFNAEGSSDEDGDELSYLWSFSDASTSTEISPSKLFSVAGEYQATLTVNDGTANSEPVVLTIVVTPQIQDPVVTTYELDSERSSLFFVSTKKEHVVETHHFNTLSGNVADNNEATLVIDLSSVDTANTTRDERMRNYLFETENYANAEVKLTLEADWLENLEVGETQLLDALPSLELHGFTVELSTQLQVTKLSSTTIIVKNVQPILLSATPFNLVPGIETLRDLANLSSISHAVPVNFTLFFVTP